jgi:predicted DNA-binding transcriptional regulator AlpA
MAKVETARFLNEKQVSELTGLALSTLRNDRFMGRRLPYIKIGRSVRYSLDDVVGFMEAHKIKTSGDEFIRKDAVNG